jgi:AcrR family transcriptional regulator
MPDAQQRPPSKRPAATPSDPPASEPVNGDQAADWHRRVIDRSLRSATKKSIDKGASLIRAATTLLERSNGDGFTVQEVADEAGQSLRTLYQYFESKDDLLLAVFEESQKVYARMITESIEGIDGPLERLAGSIIAAARMPERSSGGVDVGLSRLRLRLREVEPELVARSQQPVLAVFLSLYDDAVAADEIADRGREGSVYLICALNGAVITSQILGNDYGLALPEPKELARFVLQGLGADRDEAWYDATAAAIQLPSRPMSGTRSRRASAAATDAVASGT